jgi:glycerate 2-kinase
MVPAAELDDSPTRQVLQQAFEAALAAADPAACMPAAVAELCDGKPALVLGAGKAAASMAVAFHSVWPASVPLRGLVVTRYGHGLAPGETSGAIEVIEAAHPSPDQASVAAGGRMLALARERGSEERLWFLVSGGGSALCAAPLPGITLTQKRAAAAHLIAAGADIRQVNCVRKQLSAIKGGRLATAARPGRVTTLAISDIPGDAVADIASGPTVPDRSTQQDALQLLESYRYGAIDELRPVLEDPGLASPSPDDPAFQDDRVRLVASATTALDAAERFLEERGWEVLRLGDDLDGLAREVAETHARLAKQQATRGRRVALLSGGEARVVLRSKAGRGGRNLEYLAALALALDGAVGVHALAADSDGIDGQGDHAGGIVAPDSLAQGRRLGLSLHDLLERQDTYGYFDACGMLVRTGPTRTNVNDFRLILCG